MSGAGFFYGEDPQQDAQQRMAMALMGGNKQQQGPFGGVGDAIQMKALQQRQAQNAYQKAPPVQATLPFQGASGAQQQTALSTKMPYMGPQGIAGLFGFGG
jgi:hypothetical protein